MVRLIIAIFICTLVQGISPSHASSNCLLRLKSLLGISSSSWRRWRSPSEWKHFDMEKFELAKRQLESGKTLELDSLEVRLAHLEYIGDQGGIDKNFRDLPERVRRMRIGKQRKLLRVLMRFSSKNVFREEVIGNTLSELYTIQYAPPLQIFFGKGERDQMVMRVVRQLAERKILEVGLMEFFADLAPANKKVPLASYYRRFYDRARPFVRTLYGLSYSPFWGKVPMTEKEAWGIILNGVEEGAPMRGIVSGRMHTKYTFDIVRPAFIGLSLYALGKLGVEYYEDFVTDDSYEQADFARPPPPDLSNDYRDVLRASEEWFEENSGRPPTPCEYEEMSNYLSVLLDVEGDSEFSFSPCQDG